MEYYVYDGLTPLPGYPKLISNMSDILPGNLNAAASWGDYNKVYLFKRGKVYRYDELLKAVDPGWPYLISDIFPGVPKGLDSAFRYSDSKSVFLIEHSTSMYVLYYDYLADARVNCIKPIS